jgi:hypothetical protein
MQGTKKPRPDVAQHSISSRHFSQEFCKLQLSLLLGCGLAHGDHFCWAGGNEARDLTMAQQLLDDILVRLRFCHVAS